MEVHVSLESRPYFEVNLGAFSADEEGILADIFRAALQDTSWNSALPKPKKPVLLVRFYLADADDLEETD